MIAIIDYEMGNLRSVQKGFEKVGIEAEITSDPQRVRAAQGVVLPGVGAFGDAVRNLKEAGLEKVVVETIKQKKPFLGICLGLQLLFTCSYEDGKHDGLNIFPGVVERLPNTVKVPHMGWNQVRQLKKVPLLEGIPNEGNFYFVHSYVAKPQNKIIEATATDYAGEFVSGIWSENLYAFQFHPEKSGSLGLLLLRNFGGLCQ